MGDLGRHGDLVSLLRVSPVGIISADQQFPGGATTTITAAVNGNFGSDTDASSYASSAITFGAASRLALVTIAHQLAGGTAAAASTVTGTCITGATLLASRTLQVNTGSDGMVQVWGATTTASAAAMTVAFGVTVSGARITVTEFTNVDLTVGTLGMVQSKTAVDATGSSTAGAVTLDNAFGNTHNATFAAYAAAGGPTYTPKGGWTELRDQFFTPSNNMSFEIQFINSNDGSSTATLSGANRWGGICMELGAQ